MGSFDERRLRNLVLDRVEESPRLEFKLTLPGRSDRDKSEFLKDVTAFANAEGGTIIYGLKEDAGAAEKFSPLSNLDFDEETRRLVQMLDSQIEPRLRGAKLAWIDFDDGKIGVLSIPKSSAQPHRYHQNGQSRFVTRNHTHTVEMSYDQLRESFLRRATLLDRMEIQWGDWLNLARNDGTFRPLVKLPKLCVGLIPVESVYGEQVYDLEEIYEPSSSLMNGRRWGGCSKDFNFEGLAIYQGRSEVRLSHLVQVSRYGSLFGFEEIGDEWQSKKIIPSVRASHLIVETCELLCRFAARWGPATEWYLFGALTDISGYNLTFKSGYFDEERTFPRSQMDFPRLKLDELLPEQGFPNMLKSWLDLFWQAHGLSKCDLIEADGTLRG